MPKWIVDVTRMGYANREVTVEADTAQAAEHMALAMAGGLEFSEHHSDYEAMGCVPVQEAPTELTEAELRAIDLACMCLLENVRRGKQFQAEAIAAGEADVGEWYEESVRRNRGAGVTLRKLWHRHREAIHAND